MIVTFSPQRSDVALAYEIDADHDTITTYQDGEPDVLDFSSEDDGEWEAVGSSLDDRELVYAARREGGVLHVTLKSHVGTNAPASERFPELVEVTQATTFIFPKEEGDAES